MPVLLTDFNERHDNGNEGEVAFAEYCARNQSRARDVFRIEFDEIRIRSRVPRPKQKIEGVSFFFELTAKEEQSMGDMYLGDSTDEERRVNIEVKTEEWSYGTAFDYHKKMSPNLAFECFSVVTNRQYENHWRNPDRAFRKRLPFKEQRT